VIYYVLMSPKSDIYISYSTTWKKKVIQILSKLDINIDKVI